MTSAGESKSRFNFALDTQFVQYALFSNGFLTSQEFKILVWTIEVRITNPDKLVPAFAGMSR